MTARGIKPKAIFVHKHDMDFSKAVLKLEEFSLKEVSGRDVLVKMLAAPVNPADVMCINGIYADIPACPFVLGLEGVGEVTEAGKDVTKLKVGDWVLTGKLCPNSWRTHGVYCEDNLVKVNKAIGVKAAASLFVNPSTSYGLLKSVVQLKPGDTIIQNGANSAVGLGVIQIAKSMGVHTINIVRNRPQLDELVKKMKRLGADVVITDEDLQKKKDDIWDGEVGKPKLAIDCVGGDGGDELVRRLDIGGTIVSIGAWSGRPLIAGPGDLIFKQISFAGFWVPKLGDQIENKAIPYVEKLYREGKFQFPEYDSFALEDFQSAIKRAVSGFSDKKVLLILDKSVL